MDTVNHDLPTEIESIIEVPMQHRSVYDRSASGSMRLTQGGLQLQKVRATLRDVSSIEHSFWFKSGKPANVNLLDWQRTIAAANPNERVALLKLKGAGRINVKI